MAALNKNIRPEALNIDDETLIVEFFRKRKVFDDDEFVDILVFPTLILTKKDSLDDKFPISVDEKMFTKELGRKFNGYTYGVGKIIRLAEINNDNLHNFIKEYFYKNDIESFYNRNAECAKIREYKIEKNIETLTFGNLKNILRLILKTDSSFHKIDELNDDIKRKQFRQSYENYIVDRDRFTHGKLYFLYPDFEPVLRIKDTVGKSQYINYSKDIFLSNLLMFDFLEDVITKMNQLLDEKSLLCFSFSLTL
ncbi:MAG: hypothetical protein WKG06_04895 [Segetibacter sp.]